METIVALIVAAVVGGAFAWLTATSKRYAAPALQKLPEDRTLTERLIVEADARIGALDVKRIEDFAADWVASRLDELLKTVPYVGPVIAAADMAENAIEAYRKANPTVVARQMPTPEIMARKLAGAIGKKDVLAHALKEAIATGKQ